MLDIIGYLFELMTATIACGRLASDRADTERKLGVN